MLAGNGRAKKRKAESELSDSKLTIMRSCLPEFDPEFGPQHDPHGTSVEPDLQRAWETYLETFQDLCQVESVVLDEAKKKMLLLLMGYKMRVQLEYFGVDGGGGGGSFDQTVRVIGNFFRGKSQVRVSRFDFLFKAGKPLADEKPSDWLDRLQNLCKHCHWQSLTDSEAILLVMCQNEKLQSQILRNDAAISPEMASNFLEGGSSSLLSANANDVKKKPGSDSKLRTEPVHVELEWGESTSEGICEVKEEPEDDDDELLEDDDDYSSATEPITSQPPSIEDLNGETEIVAAIPSDPPVPPSVASIPPAVSATTKSGGGGGSRARSSCTCPNCVNSPEGVRPLKHNCHVLGCGKEYSKSSHLRAHIQSHSTVFPFGCEWPGCDKRFYRSDQLTRHKKTHTGVKNFKCTVCEKAFSRYVLKEEKNEFYRDFGI